MLHCPWIVILCCYGALLWTPVGIGHWFERGVTRLKFVIDLFGATRDTGLPPVMEGALMGIVTG